MTTLPTISPRVDDLNFVKYMDRCYTGHFLSFDPYYQQGIAPSMVSMDTLEPSHFHAVRDSCIPDADCWCGNSF